MLKSAKLVITACTLLFSLPLMAHDKCHNLTDCAFVSVYNNTDGPITVMSLTPRDMSPTSFGRWDQGNFEKLFIPPSKGNTPTSDTFFIGEKMSGFMEVGFTTLAFRLLHQSEPCVVSLILLRILGASAEAMQFSQGNCVVSGEKKHDGLHVKVMLNK